MVLELWEGKVMPWILYPFCSTVRVFQFSLVDSYDYEL